MKFSPEVRERAVRMMFESRPDPPSLWAAVESIAAQIGCSAQTLHAWVRQHARSTGPQDGPTRSEQQRIKALEREVKERRKANAILRRTRADFVQAELDRRWKSRGPSSTRIARPWGDSGARPVKTFKDYEPSFVHVDVKYLPRMLDEDRAQSLFAAIDLATRWAYVEIPARKNRQERRRLPGAPHRQGPIQHRHSPDR